MDPAAKLAVLRDALERLGVVVREEPIGEELGSAGGLCVLHGQPTVIVAPDAPLPDRLHVLARALREIGADDLWLPPEVRALLTPDDSW